MPKKMRYVPKYFQIRHGFVKIGNVDSRLVTASVMAGDFRFAAGRKL